MLLFLLIYKFDGKLLYSLIAMICRFLPFLLGYGCVRTKSDYYYIIIFKVIFFITKYVKLANIVEGDPKALFSITTTLRCRGGRNFFPWIAHLYPYNAEVSSTIFESLVRLELQSHGPLANTLPIRPIFFLNKEWTIIFDPLSQTKELKMC